MLSSRLVKEKAKALGFSACGIAPVEEAKSEADYLAQWLAAGCHAGMTYMENHRAIRLNPAQLLEGAKSVISVALNYYPKQKLPADVPHIAYYAYGRDYHDVMKGMLRQLWWELTAAESKNLPVEPEKMGQEPPAVRFCTDSAPILERYWAWRAGLGWIGKNTNLIIPGKGSFFFLGLNAIKPNILNITKTKPIVCSKINKTENNVKIEAFFLEGNSYILIEYNKTKDDNRNIPLDSLSSGEKKLLVIFMHCLFNEDVPIIIDEPEISLSIIWQENLLPDLLEKTKIKQVIVATHSSAVISDSSLDKYIIPLPNSVVDKGGNTNE